MLMVSVLVLMSCARSADPNVKRGSDYKYKPGYPEVRFSAVGFLDETNKPRITIAADIVYGSMIFREVNNKQQAQLAIDARVVKKESESEGDVVENKHDIITVKENDKNITTSQKSFIYQKQVDVKPGDYKVYLTVTDKTSGKKITRQTTTSIPDPQNDQIDLTDIRMLAKDADADSAQWLPVTTYNVTEKSDSLMFIFQATNNSSEQPLVINAKLISYESDSAVARPMFYNNYSHSSIEYKGIDLDEEQTIQKSQRKLLQEGSVFIEFRFKQQKRGNYRFVVRSDKQEEELFKARDFGVKTPYYPAIKTPRELARPLVYLMDEDNYEDLLAIKDPDSLKQAIDRFWLRQIGNENEARQVLKKYYQRVEEANKQFSNYKEGWKTDPGMMYILFGPPWYYEHHLDTMKWSYSYDRQDPRRNFFFIQPKISSEFYPFDHFVLQRDQSYFNVEYQQRQLWLSGLILQRNI